MRCARISRMIGRDLAAVAVCLMTAALALGAENQGGLDLLRVYLTQPSSFEYFFAGIASGTNDQPFLVFNHHGGRTFFVKTGDTLGPYLVKSLTSENTRVFYPTLNNYLEETVRKAMLAAPSGEIITLEQNRPLPWPGYTAWLVRLDNGGWWSVQAGDVFAWENTCMRVEAVTTNAVAIATERDRRTIAMIVPAEQEALNRLWTAQSSRQEAKPAEPVPPAQPEAKTYSYSAPAPAREPGTHITVRYPGRFFFGTEYRFPTQFRIYPYASYGAGQPPVSYVVIPGGFETRYSGISISAP